MPTKPRITLYEVECKGHYHEHWLAWSHWDAARRAISHAQEAGLKLDGVRVSSMVQPADHAKGGLVYILNDTRNYAMVRGRLIRNSQPDKPHPPRGDHCKGHRGQQALPKPTQTEG